MPKLQEGYDLDYIVGSVHHVDTIPIDFSAELFDKAEEKHKGTENLFIAYYNSQYNLLKQLKPTIIGHFDLIKMYRPDFELTDEITSVIQRNLEFAVGYGALFEINSRYDRVLLESKICILHVLSLRVSKVIITN